MKAHLLFRDRDAEIVYPDVDGRARPGVRPGDGASPNSPARLEAPVDLVADLGLEQLFAAMAGGDAFLGAVARQVVLAPLGDLDTIGYRQAALHDTLVHRDAVQAIYDLVVGAIDGERRNFFGLFTRSPESILHRSSEVMAFFVGVLRQLRSLAEHHADRFESEAFTTLFSMLSKELSDDYFAEVDAHLKRLRFSGGVLVSAELGSGAHGASYVLRAPNQPTGRRHLRDLFGAGHAHTVVVADRDEAGLQTLGQLRDRGVNLVADALARSVDHILAFFRLLRMEIGFYLGAAELHRVLASKGEPVCVPEVLPTTAQAWSARGLVDVCLSLTTTEPVVGNDVDADAVPLVMVTGANQGGKSTFLRSVGQAQLMAQCGLFAGATSLRLSIAEGCFTHFKREEDTSMTHGKLDEELYRMRAIVDQVAPGSVVLCNESFSATNESEGSEIGRQVVQALVDCDVRVFFVTHFFDLADGFARQAATPVRFLRAERGVEGSRPFHLVEAPPRRTGYGEDVYRRVFGDQAAR